jgi:hypothetical protein
MRFNDDTNSVPLDHFTHDINNIPMPGYGAAGSIPQTPSIVNNMMYYQGIYHLI